MRRMSNAMGVHGCVQWEYKSGDRDGWIPFDEIFSHLIEHFFLEGCEDTAVSGAGYRYRWDFRTMKEYTYRAVAVVHTRDIRRVLVFLSNGSHAEGRCAGHSEGRHAGQSGCCYK